jgi:hypothetical protein
VNKAADRQFRKFTSRTWREWLWDYRSLIVFGVTVLVAEILVALW